MPKVTIFMSSYNHARYLRESINSVLNQTFEDYELFIVDDASTDDSWSIIQEYTDARIHAMRNAENRNDKAVMRQVINELASGEYFAVHHSDNLWEPGKLQAQVNFLDSNSDFGAVFTRVLRIDETGSPLRVERPSSNRTINRSRHEWLNYFFYQGNAFCHPSILIRRNCYRVCGSYRDGFAQIPDLDMWVRLCLKYPIQVLPEKLVRYRVPTDAINISANNPKTRIRKRYEKLKMLENYLLLSDRQEMLAVFPEAARYDTPQGFDSAYALARLSLNAPDQVVTRLFGLNILYDILGDPVRAKKIFDLYGFTHKDFTALSAANDIFSTEQLYVLESELISSRQNVHSLTRELREIHLSSGWRFITFLRRLGSILIPAGSWREKAARAFTRALALPFSFHRERKVSRQLQQMRSSSLFDREWYLERYPDVALSGIDPARHYLLHGGLEGRDPGPEFSSEWYIAHHPEIVAQHINPLVHYLVLQHGK